VTRGDVPHTRSAPAPDHRFDHRENNLAKITDQKRLVARLGDEELKATGRVTVAFSFLDFMARTLLARLIGKFDQIPMTLIIHESFRWVLDKIRVLRVYAPRTDLQEAIDEWLAAADKVRERRNDVAHSLWLVAEDQAEDSENVLQWLEFKARKSPLRFNFAEVTVSDLNELAGQIDAAASVGGSIAGEIARQGHSLADRPSAPEPEGREPDPGT
jgi:hypothetical protein